ncbi:MAG TPA: glycosyltransferase [Anaerolineae bacterium]|nr:glycosyltransferase [Anaerolineae bacterium]
MTTITPNTAIIIPALNSPIIDHVITAILNQSAIDHITQIIVIGKDEAQLLPQHPLVRLIDTGHPIPPGAARNRGIQNSTAPYLIFLDSDCLPQPGWLAEHLNARHAGFAVVGGGVLPHGRNYWSLTYNLTMFHAYFSTSQPAPRPFLPTLNLAVARTVIDHVGLLDESLPRSQDLDWTTRMAAAGHQPYFWPSAAIDHHHNRTTWPLVWRDCVRSGHHARQVRLQHATNLNTPFWLRSRPLTLALSPAIGAAVTLKIIASAPRLFLRHLTTIPAIYATKIGWCFGAAQKSEP